MSTSTPTDTCPSCGAELRPNAVYCRECGAMTPAATGKPLDARDPGSSPTAGPPLLTPSNRPRPSVSHADQATARRPRWFLGTFWALFTLVVLIAGIVGPKWLLLVGIATGAYSVYLYRGGRYGFFIF